MNETLIYTKTNDAQSMGTKMFLDARKIAYTERNIDDNEGYQLEAQATGFSSVPIIIPATSYNIAPWSGFKPEKLTGLI